MKQANLNHKTISIAFSIIYVTLQAMVIIAYYYPPPNAPQIIYTAIKLLPWIAGLGDFEHWHEGGKSMALALALAHVPFMILGLLLGVAAPILNGGKLNHVSPIEGLLKSIAAFGFIVVMNYFIYWDIYWGGRHRLGNPILACLAPLFLGLSIWIVLFRFKKVITK